MSDDPACTDPDKYRVVFENEHVRVLDYTDRPGDRTSLHAHPDSVMYTLSSFRRRLYGANGESRDVDIESGTTGWLPAQRHAGHNIGDSETRVIFVELKGRAASATAELGPSGT